MRTLLCTVPVDALSIAIGSATPVVSAASAKPETYCLGHVINGVCYRQFPPGQG